MKSLAEISIIMPSVARRMRIGNSKPAILSLRMKSTDSTSVVIERGGFPTDRYIVDQLATHVRVAPLSTVVDALDVDVALVVLSAVDYRWAALADIEAICGYLIAKPAGATPAELAAVFDAKALDRRKLSALKCN